MLQHLAPPNVQQCSKELLKLLTECQKSYSFENVLGQGLELFLFWAIFILKKLVQVGFLKF